MKKIIFLLFCFIPFLGFGQKRFYISDDNAFVGTFTATGSENNYAVINYPKVSASELFNSIYLGVNRCSYNTTIKAKLDGVYLEVEAKTSNTRFTKQILLENIIKYDVEFDTKCQVKFEVKDGKVKIGDIKVSFETDCDFIRESDRHQDYIMGRLHFKDEAYFEEKTFITKIEDFVNHFVDSVLKEVSNRNSW